MNGTLIRVLLVEDDAEDARLFHAMLAHEAKHEFQLARVGRLAEAMGNLRGHDYDLVLSDLGLPDSQGLPTFRSLKAEAPQLPIVVLSGLEDEDVALEAVQEGAQDYLVKSQVNGPLLARAIRYAIERKRIESERDRLIRELQEALSKVKLLSGLLPICAWCKKVRDDHDYWQEVDCYVASHCEARFTHGICPVCLLKAKADLTSPKTASAGS
jgi:sigma-B regulation protein RsbU (phosphoserine phosphatase)